MERRNVNYVDLQMLQADADRLATVGYKKAGQWGLAETLQHLRRSFQASLSGAEYKADPFTRIFVAPFVLKRILTKEKWPQGEQTHSSLAPRQVNSQEVELEQFKQVLNIVANHKGEFKPHPVYGRLTREQYRKLHLVHAAHHMSFLLPNDRYAF